MNVLSVKLLGHLNFTLPSYLIMKLDQGHLACRTQLPLPGSVAIVFAVIVLIVVVSIVVVLVVVVFIVAVFVVVVFVVIVLLAVV